VVEELLGGDQMTINTFQTVKLSLECWQLVDKIMVRENIAFSEAMERLIRHGYIHYQKIQEELA
jgi:hypothetical protein